METVRLDTSKRWVPASSRISLVLIIMIAGFWDQSRAQDTTCIPFASGPPYLPGGPNWWNGVPPSIQKRFDDPRWLGSVSHTDGTTDAQHVDFRAVYRTDSIFLSWVTKVDDGLQ